MELEEVKLICRDIKMSCLGNYSFQLRIERDNKDKESGRIFMQVVYTAPNIKNPLGSMYYNYEEWHGRKFYLSDHMTVDEIVKTAYLAFKLAVEHEVMEGFTHQGVVVFNPHAHFEALKIASAAEVKRESI